MMTRMPKEPPEHVLPPPQPTVTSTAAGILETIAAPVLLIPGLIAQSQPGNLGPNGPAAQYQQQVEVATTAVVSDPVAIAQVAGGVTLVATGIAAPAGAAAIAAGGARLAGDIAAAEQHQDIENHAAAQQRAAEEAHNVQVAAQRAAEFPPSPSPMASGPPETSAAGSAIKPHWSFYFVRR